MMALPQGNVSLPFDACTTLRWDTLPHKLHTFVCNMMKTTQPMRLRPSHR